MHPLLNHLANIQVCALLDDNRAVAAACLQDLGRVLLMRNGTELSNDLAFILRRDESQLVVLLEEPPAGPNEAGILRDCLKSRFLYQVLTIISHNKLINEI
jgi:hypothetical protein